MKYKPFLQPLPDSGDFNYKRPIKSANMDNIFAAQGHAYARMGQQVCGFTSASGSNESSADYFSTNTTTWTQTDASSGPNLDERHLIFRPSRPLYDAYMDTDGINIERWIKVSVFGQEIDVAWELWGLTVDEDVSGGSPIASGQINTVDANGWHHQYFLLDDGNSVGTIISSFLVVLYARARTDGGSGVGRLYELNITEAPEYNQSAWMDNLKLYGDEWITPAANLAAVETWNEDYAETGFVQYSPSYQPLLRRDAPIAGVNAVEFDGVSEFMVGGVIDNDEGFYFSALIFPDDLTTEQTIFHHVDTSGNTLFRMYHNNAGILKVESRHSAATETLIGQTLSSSIWQDVTVCVRSTGGSREALIYHNAVLTASSTPAGPWDETIAGGETFLATNSGKTNYFNGRVGLPTYVIIGGDNTYTTFNRDAIDSLNKVWRRTLHGVDTE